MGVVCREKYSNESTVTCGYDDDACELTAEDKIEAYGIDDTFYIEASHHSTYNTRINVKLNKDDAKRLIRQLQEFIAQNP